MSKLGFSDILKNAASFSTKPSVKEDKMELKKFVNEAIKKQAEILKLKDIDENQLKIVIKL
jgi:hypothetical protein